MLNRTLQNGSAANPLANLPGNVCGESGLRWPAHQTKRPANAYLRDDAEERRLAQLYSRSPTKRFVEDRIAGIVSELGKDNGVLVGEFRCAMGIEVTG